jgi:HEAT repeat protein
MPASPDASTLLKALFDAERAAREAHDDLAQLAETDPAQALPALAAATREALELVIDDEDEASLRLARIAGVLGEMEGPRAVDLLIDVLAAEAPEARQAAGEALSGLAFDRFKEVALGVERALERLPAGSPALSELPYVLAAVPEPGVAKLLGKFLQHRDADAVAAAIEAFVEIGDPSAVRLLEGMTGDTRRVELEDEGGTAADASIGELASEACDILAAEARGSAGDPRRGAGA